MLEELLLPAYPCASPETTRELPDDIVLYWDDFGSNRFVQFVNGEAVAGLQVVANDKVALVANIFTAKPYRRRGYATILYRVAQSHFPKLQPSPMQSEDGRQFFLSLRLE